MILSMSDCVSASKEKSSPLIKRFVEQFCQRSVISNLNCQTATGSLRVRLYLLFMPSIMSRLTDTGPAALGKVYYVM